MARLANLLRDAVVMSALKGNLTGQHREDGEVDEALRKTKAKKTELVKKGLIRKERTLHEVREDEMQFDIPDNWRWVRLQDASQTIVDCPHSTPKYYDEVTGYYAIGTKCLNERGEITKLFNIDEDTYHKRIERLEPQKNDIVYSREGSIICRAVLLPSNKKICLGQRVMLIRCSEALFPRYAQIYLMAHNTESLLTKNYKGVGVKHINVADVINLPIPLPPIEEQQRIVRRVDGLMAKIDEFERIEIELESLKKAFPREMKEALLQAAMEGKLIEQKGRDNDVKTMLLEISNEREKLIEKGIIKKARKLPEVKAEDVPFRIPTTWKWVKSDNIGAIVVGATPSTKNNEYWKDGTIPWLPSGCCQDCMVTSDNTTKKYITQKGYDSCSTKMMKKNTVLIALTGATAGKVGLLQFEACGNQSLVGIMPFSVVLPKFLFYQLMSRRGEILSDCSGSAQPHISKAYVSDMNFILAPIKDQQCIVDCLDSLLPLCDELEVLS